MLERQEDQFFPKAKLLDRIPIPLDEVTLFALGLCGGTIFCKVDSRGIRTGEAGDFDASEEIARRFDKYAKIMDPVEARIYDGPSENYNPEIMATILTNIIYAINTKRVRNNFFIFLGSDMAETLAKYTQLEIGRELEEKSIRLVFIWAKDPARMDGTDAWTNIETAFESILNHNVKGGAYLAAHTKIIPALQAKKKTSMSEALDFYDINGHKDVYEETLKRNYITGIAYRLAVKLMGISLFDFIERQGRWNERDSGISAQLYLAIQGKLPFINNTVPDRDSVNAGKELWDLASSSSYLPVDPTGKLLVFPLNLPVFAPTPDELYEKFRNVNAVIFRLNHSLTTSQSMAETVATVCHRRIEENRPLLAFASTENDEYRSFNPKMGIYPSAQLLHKYVVPIPGAFLPSYVKLYAALHYLGYKPCRALIDFMLRDLVGEVDSKKIYNTDVRLVKATLFSGKNH